MDQQSAAEMAASLFSARTGGGGYDVDGAGGGYDVDGAGASVPSQGQPHPLTLSMSSGTGSQSSPITMQVGAHAAAEYVGTDGAGKKRGGGESTGEKRRGKKRGTTSQYHGVHRYGRTGRYTARLWDNSYMKEGQTRKGREVHLGYYDNEEKAARAHDLAVLKYSGKSTHLHFLIEDYKEELVEMDNMSRPEYVAHLRRKSSGFSRGALSQYCDVTRQKWTGRYEAHLWDNSYMKEGQTRKGRQVHLGGYDNEEKAARAYDLAALKYWGKSTHLNFPIEDYKDELVEMEKMSTLEYVAHLKRKSSSFLRGALKYRGVRLPSCYQCWLVTSILRYDVDKIMESNTPLPGDQVRCWKAGVAGTAASDANAVAVARAVTAAVARADDHGGNGGGGGGHHQQQQHHEDALLSELFSQLEDIVSL